MVSLADAYIIGQENFEQWSTGFDSEGYLKVLPHPNEKIPFRDPFHDWQEGVEGNYFSSWGPEEELVATLTMSNLDEIEIDGFGTLQAGDGIVPWLNNAVTPYEEIRGYNGTVPGPMLITEPGDTLKIELINELTTPAQSTNFHTHGLHVSALGHGDNVLFSLPSGESWDVEIPIPEDHFIGPDWYHPHLHGDTNEQVASGLGGFLILTAPHDIPDLDKFDPSKEPFHFMAIQSFGVQQTDRPGTAGDPLNQNPDVALPAGTPIEVMGTDPEGDPVYEMSDAVFVGFNAKPIFYDPTEPLGNRAEMESAYGSGGLAEPVENVIHTVNGQYNPTIETDTGQWELFSFANMTVNSFHVVQLVKEEGDQLIPQEVTLVAIDGDASGVVEDISREVTELPLLNPGSRVSVQHWFEEPGTYYLLSNGTEEILGEGNAPNLIGDGKGFNDGHLIWGSQVLATVEVTGETISQGAPPEPYDSLIEQSEEINELLAAASSGNFDRERTFVWDANIGGALQEGNDPDDLDVASFEGTYTINGEFYATDGSGMPPLTMPMLGTTEVWNVQNRSGKADEDLPDDINIPLLEWHPFHIHQNDFVVMEINGLPVEDIEQNYLAGVLSDTIALPPSYEPGSVTAENPYGTPMFGGEASEVKILMEFEDFPGSYVNHCHILFHEDAGMMAVVRVILNTDDIWIGNSSTDGEINLYQGSAFGENISMTPYGEDFGGGIDVAIADVNFLENPVENYVTDNVTDVATIQSSLDQAQDAFTVKLFDGKTLFEEQATGKQFFDEEDQNVLITEFQPFQEVDVSAAEQASIATADLNGDGFAEIIVGVSNGTTPLIEIYSGQDFQLMARLSPFPDNEGISSSLHLAGGDVNGDNFEDLMVTGGGSLALYDGLSLDGLLRDGVDTLDGVETASAIALLDEAVKPYGDSYTGEIEVTSGYILQTPLEPNEQPVQTNNANITTMALGDLPAGEETIKVHTYAGGHHHTGHDTNTEAVNTNETETTSPLRVDVAFTPEENLTTLSGTFADIPTGNRGTGVLLGQSGNGTQEIIYLQEENLPATLNVPTPSQPPQLVFGSPVSNVFDATNANDNFDGNSNLLFTGSGDDEVDGSQGVGSNRLYAGSGEDQLLGSSNDRLFGGTDSDTLTSIGDHNRLYGGSENDELEVIDGGQHNRLFGGEGQDILELTLSGGSNHAYGGANDDTFFLGTDDALIGGSGDDSFFVTNGGGNTLTGGSGADAFWVADAEIPASPNTINLGTDLIGIGGFTQDQLGFGLNDDGNGILSVNGTEVATFVGLSDTEVQGANFTFA